jgi:hypothetical protein
VLDDLALDDIVMQDYMDLSNRLDNAEDKLNKAVEGFETGASAGKENLQSWVSQMLEFETEVADTTFDENPANYKEELIVRSQIMVFLGLERVLPSVEPGGLPPRL